MSAYFKRFFCYTYLSMTHPTYYTYIVECADGTYYIGKTCNLEHRVRQHNGEVAGGAKYTKMRRPVVMKLYEEYESATLALRREYALKQLTRKQKEKLIYAGKSP